VKEWEDFYARREQMRYTQPIFRFYRNPLNPTDPELRMEIYDDAEGSWYEHRMAFTDAMRFCQRLSGEIISIALNNPDLRRRVIVRDVDLEAPPCQDAQQGRSRARRGVLARLLGR
jgi:hypothetical protein